MVGILHVWSDRTMATSITENLRSYTRLQPDFLRGAALMACLLSLSGCALKPFARIDGSGGSVALREHADVTIVAVGDRWFLDGLTTWDVPPGTHEITFVSAFRPELRVPPTLQASNANPGAPITGIQANHRVRFSALRSLLVPCATPRCERFARLDGRGDGDPRDTDWRVCCARDR